MGLTANDILALYVLYMLHFIPILTVFLTSVTRFRDYKKNEHKVHPSDGGSDETRRLADFMYWDRVQYDTFQRTHSIILPYYGYIILLVVSGAIETVAMFLVWYDKKSYGDLTYFGSMGIQFAIVGVKGIWLYAFFESGDNVLAAWTTLILVILSFINFVILIIDETTAVNMLLYGYIFLFYFYSFFVAIVFTRKSKQAAYNLVNTPYSLASVSDMIFGRDEGRTHGHRLAPENSRYVARGS